MKNTTSFNIPARYIPNRGLDYLDVRSLVSCVETDVKEGDVQIAFDFTYSAFDYLGRTNTKAFKDAHRQCLHLNTEYSDYRMACLIGLAASNPKYDQAPLSRALSARALANDHNRHDILGSVFRPLVQEIHGFSDKPYTPRDPKYKYSTLNDELPFVPATKSLWRDAEAGRFTKAVLKLSPLVNLLVEQEAQGVFPLGIGVSGQNMSEIRYQWTNSPIVWAINQAKKNIRDSICSAIAGHEGKFINGTARIIAANMLAIIADVDAGIGVGAHLPGDLQRLMICRDALKQGRPLDKRWKAKDYPDVPGNYVQKPRVWTAFQTISPTPTERIISPEEMIITSQDIRHQKTLNAILKRRKSEKPVKDDLVRSL